LKLALFQDDENENLKAAKSKLSHVLSTPEMGA
jgi:hypothetical protein